jgi:hypothetical protein
VIIRYRADNPAVSDYAVEDVIGMDNANLFAVGLVAVFVGLMTALSNRRLNGSGQRAVRLDSRDGYFNQKP